MDIDPSINIGGRINVHIQDPPVVDIDGNTRVVFSDPPQITSRVGPASIRVFQNNVWVNDLSIRSADGRWYRTGDAWANHRDDRTRHRMVPLEPLRWMYEWTRYEAYLRADRMDRFAYDHAIGDRDAGSRENPGALPAWAFRQDASSGDEDGWLDPRTGSIHETYSQTRPCWHASDLRCPVHGNNQTQDPGPEPNGFWHERRGDEIERVDCPLCAGQDHDGDGRTDIRVTNNDVRRLRTPARQSVQFPSRLGPLVLTESFFKFGINVGCWRPPEDYVPPFFASISSVLATGAPASFANPEWGFFAVASARAGLRKPSGGFRYDFPPAQGDRQGWVEDDAENLYEPEWEARLWPVRDAIRTADIQSLSEVDRGTNYLFRSLIDSPWRKDFFDPPDANVPRLLHSIRSTRTGGTFDFNDPALEDVLRH